MHHHRTVEAYASEAADFTPAAVPAPHVYLMRVTRAINDGPATIVHVLRAHDESDAHNLARQQFVDATRITTPHRVDTLARLRRLTDVERAAVDRFRAAEQGAPL